MEAKRYDNRVPLEALLGKIANTTLSVGPDIDLWVMSATVPIGDNDAAVLQKFAHHEGLSALILDWEEPLPNLAVLLAFTRAQSVAWFGQHVDAAHAVQIDVILGVVASSDRFEDVTEELRLSTSAGEVGLDALRSHSTRWFRDRLIDRNLSRSSFN